MPRAAIVGLILTISLFSFLLYLNFAVPNDYISITDPSVNTKDLKDIRCKNFLTQKDAQKFFNAHPNLSSLDKDSDGVVCESLPK